MTHSTYISWYTHAESQMGLRYIDINKLMSREIYHIKIILVSYQGHVKILKF